MNSLGESQWALPMCKLGSSVNWKPESTLSWWTPGPRSWPFLNKEIDALGLRRGRGVFRLVSATGPVDVETYHADGELMGQEFAAILVPAATPLLG